MYLEHFGFRVLPFENVPDPAFFFDDGEYQRILRRLTSAIGAGRGLMVVAGPIGAGKTTLSQKLMGDLPETTVQLWLAEPPGTDRELYQLLLQRLGMQLTWDSRVQALNVLRDRLLKLHAEGGRCLVVVDESHKFSDEGLEAVRLLNNLEQDASKLIQVLMLGQEELTVVLTGPGHEAFRQRIANMEILGRMQPPHVRAYIRHRLRVAGGVPGIFPELILDAIAAAAGGIPRLINSLCERSLRNAFEADRSVVNTKDLLQAAEEVGVHRKAFHYLVGRERTTGGQPRPAPDHSPELQTAPPPFMVTPGEPAPPFDLSPQNSTAIPTVAPRRLLVPLSLLAGGVAALAASLLFYCSRATAAYGGDCLAHLVRDVFR